MNYIAINHYRSSTSNGFANTYHLYRCSKDLQKYLLTHGLTVPDCAYMDGTCAKSTNGIRTLTDAERSMIKRSEYPDIDYPYLDDIMEVDHKGQITC